MNHRSIPVLLVTLGLSHAAQGGLLGTQVSLETVFQETLSDEPVALSFPEEFTVVDPGVEIPDVSVLEVPGSPSGINGLVETSIDVGNDFIEIDFDNVLSTRFASGIQNTYIFTFDGQAGLEFTEATIDSDVTTLGLEAEDVTFDGNKLLINVEGLPFSTSTFVRVNLTTVPEPTSVGLFAATLFCLTTRRRRSRLV